MRDSENQPEDSVYDDAVILVGDDRNEKEKEKKVDKVCFRLLARCCSNVLNERTTPSTQAFLDLTDRQNRDFRYVL